MAEALPHLPSGNQGRDQSEWPPRIIVLVEPMVQEQVALLAEDLVLVLTRRFQRHHAEVPSEPP